MSEQCLFYMPDFLYSEGSPIVVVSGRVVKDETTFQNKIILNLRNISSRNIVAVTMRALLLNTASEVIAYQDLNYSDFRVADNMDFGDKLHFVLPPVVFSNITLMLTGVYFEDGYVMNSELYFLDVIPTPELISVGLKDDKLSKLYRQRFGANATKQFTTYKDLWICTCGAIHKNDMAFCSECGVNRQALESFSVEEFKKQVDDSDVMTTAIYAKEPTNVSEKSVSKEKEYQKGLYIMNNETSYSALYDAMDIFKKLGNYKDSENMVKELDRRLVEISVSNHKRDKIKRWTKISVIAIVLISVFGTFTYFSVKRDRQNKKFDKAEEYYENGEYEKAKELYAELAEDDYIGSGFGGKTEFNKMPIRMEMMDAMEAFEDSDYYDLAVEYAEKAEGTNRDVDLTYEIKVENDWAVNVVIEVDQNYSSEEDYNDKKRDDYYEWDRFATEYDNEMNEIYSRDQYIDGTYNSVHINWEVNVNAKWDIDEDNPGFDYLYIFSNGAFGFSKRDLFE